MPAQTNRRRWSPAVPFLAALLVQGLPLSLEFAAPEQRWAEEMHSIVLTRVTTLGYENAWLPTIVWGSLYLLAAVAVLRRPRPVFPKPIMLNVAALLVLVASSALWSHYPYKVLMNTVHAIGAVLLAVAAGHAYREHPWTAIRNVAYVLGVNISAHLAAILVAPGMTVDWSGRWMGLAPNPNGLGVVAFVTFWANAAALFAKTRKKAIIHVLFLAEAAVALAGTQSVTASVCAATAVLGILLLIARARLRVNGRPMLGGGLLFGLAAVAMGMLAYIAWDDLSRALGKSADMTGRFPLWETAIALIEKRPLLGWGFDDNATVIELTSLPHGHFHNGVLDLTVRGGMVAVALVAVYLVRAVRDVIIAERRNVGVSAVVLPLMAAILVNNLTEVSLAATRNVLWLLLLFVGFWAAGGRIPTRPRLTRGAM